MDHREGDIRGDIEGTRAAMTEKVDMVAERAQETMEAVKSTADRAMVGFKQVQETVEGAKSAVNTVIESVKLTVEETVERVNTTADLLDHVGRCDPLRLYPWELGQERVLGSRPDAGSVPPAQRFGA